MSFGDNRRSPSAFSFAAEPVTGQPVKITPNRRSIDDKLPVLGFTVQTGGLPFFEVLLTTDRSLFAPANAGKRNAGNFYVSRQDSGLIRATGPEAVYLAPPAVLCAFAKAEPRPSAIYYTLIAYRSEDGSGPVFAQSPESLFIDAPSVTIAPGFSGQTLSRVLGVPARDLKPVYGQSERPMAFGNAATNGEAGFATERAFANGNYHDNVEDRAEGEDGYDVARSASEEDWLENELSGDYAARHYGDDDFLADRDLFSDSYAADQPSYREHMVNGYAGATYERESEGDYEDGYEDEYGPIQSSLSGAQESVFPAGADEPAPLSDEEQPYGEDMTDDETDDHDDEDLDQDYFSAGADAAYGAPMNFADDQDGEPYDDDDGYDMEAMAYKRLHVDGDEDEESPPKAHKKHRRDKRLYEEDEKSPRKAHKKHCRDKRMYKEGDDDEGYESKGARFKSRETSYEAGHYGDETELTFEALDSAPTAKTTRQPLTIEIKKRIIERIAKFESGRDRYSAINPDGEYEGRFGTSHPAYHRYHVGLSYGLIQFTQDSGLLGQLLVMMRDRDGQAFSQAFGGDPKILKQLIDVTTADGAASRKAPDGRSARVQPVGGADLWREPWLSRFRQAGGHVPFQAAQNQLAAESFLDPMLKFAGWMGLDTERALAMVVDRAIQMGRGGATRWIISASGPIQTDALRGQALAALGHSDLRRFQRATPGLGADGEFGPMSHAAMVAALRALGAKSPIPIPTREQVMDAMVRGAAGRPWAHRVDELRKTGDLGDTPLQF